MDAMAAAGKLLVMEDDTRTRVCNAVPGCPLSGQPLPIRTTTDSVNAITRNMLTTGLHGGAQYFVSLCFLFHGLFCGCLLSDEKASPP